MVTTDQNAGTATGTATGRHESTSAHKGARTRAGTRTGTRRRRKGNPNWGKSPNLLPPAAWKPTAWEQMLEREGVEDDGAAVRLLERAVGGGSAGAADGIRNGDGKLARRIRDWVRVHSRTRYVPTAVLGVLGVTDEVDAGLW